MVLSFEFLKPGKYPFAFGFSCLLFVVLKVAKLAS